MISTLRKVSSSLFNGSSRSIHRSIRELCATSSAADLNVSRRFRAALLHPNKENLKIETLESREKLADDFIRIGVDYCSIDRIDVRYLKEANDIDLPYIPGTEMAGEVLEVGKNFRQSFSSGDKVAVISDDVKVGGGLSQECIVSGNACIPLNNKISPQEAVTLFKSYGNAHLAFSRHCKLNENDNVIVLAGSGGDGLAAVEIAGNLHRANVFVIFDSDGVQALARDESARRAMNVQLGLTKVYKFLMKTVRLRGAKVIYDTLGSSLIHVVSDFVAPNGHVFTVDPFLSLETVPYPYFKKETGKRSNQEESPTARNEMGNIFEHISLAKLHTTNPALFKQITDETIDMFAKERIKPYVSKISTLSEANKAIRFVDRKKCLGKVLVDLKRTK